MAEAGGDNIAAGGSERRLAEVRLGAVVERRGLKEDTKKGGSRYGGPGRRRHHKGGKVVKIRTSPRDSGGTEESGGPRLLGQLGPESSFGDGTLAGP